MLKADFNTFLETALRDIVTTSQSGQSEYALGQDAFDNFNRLAINLQTDRKKILWVYLQKHLDGITSYLNGHTSQREDVRGRIKDVIVYMLLLWGIIDEETSPLPSVNAINSGLSSLVKEVNDPNDRVAVQQEGNVGAPIPLGNNS